MIKVAPFVLESFMTVTKPAWVVHVEIQQHYYLIWNNKKRKAHHQIDLLHLATECRD